MKLRNWLRRFARACGTISLLAGAAAAWQTGAAGGPAKTPAFAVLNAADAAQWQAWAKETGWKVIVPGPQSGADSTVDARLQSLASAVQDAVKNDGVDPARVYLAGRGGDCPAVFYGVARMPDVWAAALAVGGSPQPAIDTGRIFTADFQNTPILWAGGGPEDQALAEKLKASGLNLEWRPGAGLTVATAVQWLSEHKREEYPLSIDCEIVSTAAGGCYWVRMTAFDPTERNDVLQTTLVRPDSGAKLDLGDFDYKKDDPGPGILVSTLPKGYDGPLKLGDRIIELDGRPIEGARQLEESLRQVTEEKRAVVMILRGNRRERIETRIIVAKRPSFVSARVQAKYLPAEKEIQIASRTVTGMQVTIPPQWLPATLYWNGLSMEEIREPGCRALRIEKELLRSEKCR